MEKEEREKKALEGHARPSKQFQEDRLGLERERERMIDEIINSEEDEDKRKGLRALRGSWDKEMRGAGSRHNRFVLAQTLFWEHFHEVWHPNIRKL